MQRSGLPARDTSNRGIKPRLSCLIIGTEYGTVERQQKDAKRRPPPFHGGARIEQAVCSSQNKEVAGPLGVFACLCDLGARPICARLPLVASAGVHKGSMLCSQWRQQTCSAEKLGILDSSELACSLVL